MKRIHTTRLAARTALRELGYVVAFSSPGRPELWAKGNLDRRAVRRCIRGADVTWELVAYPEPSECAPGELAGLAARDGAVLSGGLDIENLVSDDGAWLG